MLHIQSHGGLPLYRQLARLYETAMVSGSLLPGMQMPSVRELRQRHTVSLSTALQVLRHLEDQGLVEARERVGYFVRVPVDAAMATMPAAREPEMAVPLPPDASVFAGINERISLILKSPASRAACC